MHGTATVAYLSLLSLIHAEEGLAFGEVAKRMGELWKNLSETEKAPYQVGNTRQQRLVLLSL